MTNKYLPSKLNKIIKEDLEEISREALPWERLRNKKVLVTGGAGFLASYLVQALIAVGRKYNLNCQVICVVRNLNAAKKRYEHYQVGTDLLLFEQDVSLPLAQSFPAADLIIHSASQASPKFYGVDPVGTLKANSVGTMYLLEHAVKTKSQKFMFFSSGEIYGIPIDSNRLIGESDYGYLDPVDVRSCYSESKRIGENMCISWAKQFGLDVSIVRPFHTYGPGMALDDGRVFADFVADVVAGRDIVLKSDGLARRPFCYISDAVLAFLVVLLKGRQAEAYNVANPHAEVSVSDLANIIANLFPGKGIGVRFDIPPVANSYLKSPIARQLPSIEKIAALGWRPQIDIASGFRRTIMSYW